MNNLCALIDRLITLSIQEGLIETRDTIYIRNRLLALYHVNEYEASAPLSLTFYETLDALSELALSMSLIEDTVSAKDIFTSTLMNTFLPIPSQVEKDFWHRYEKDPVSATDGFYKMSQYSNYIKMNRIAKNVMFKTDSPYGQIDITINLSKPEKDPKEIARLKTLPPNKYPSCLLCVENEGYAGTLSLPDRANHRMIELNLSQKTWYLQYSPYLYYNEHCIVLSQTHEPMKICLESFYNLLNFVELFPHYFLGSNADLPIVGGSILTHEHYQGGRYEFPIHKASVVDTFSINKYPSITCKILNWPLSTIQLVGKSMDDVANCTNHILEVWKNYSDEAANILAHTDGTPHNTITPIAQKIGDNYVMTVVLRNNRTTDEHPLGIFHPHSDVQHIKKENIGLIEVMGLAILPGRLLKELDLIKSFITGNNSEIPEYHVAWAHDLKAHYIETEDIDLYVQKALGDKFTRVLEDAGVFKMTDEGIAHFKQFVSTL